MTADPAVGGAGAPGGRAGDGAVTEDAAWALAESVALRPEPFGALAYDFHTRRLTFLKTPTLVVVCRALAESSSVGAALDTAGVPDAERPAYLAALGTLADGGLIERRSNPT